MEENKNKTKLNTNNVSKTTKNNAQTKQNKVESDILDSKNISKVSNVDSKESSNIVQKKSKQSNTKDITNKKNINKETSNNKKVDNKEITTKKAINKDKSVVKIEPNSDKVNDNVVDNSQPKKTTQSNKKQTVVKDIIISENVAEKDNTSSVEPLITPKITKSKSNSVNSKSKQKQAETVAHQPNKIEQPMYDSNYVEEKTQNSVKNEQLVADITIPTNTLDNTENKEEKTKNQKSKNSKVKKEKKVKIEKSEKNKNIKEKKQKIKKSKKIKYNTPFVSINPDVDFGLNQEQVDERNNRGLNNKQPDIISKSYFKIFRTNVFTLFNMLNFFLGSLVLIYGNVKNALFLGIITLNIIVGIFQEVRSKKTLEKMSLLSAPHIDVVRNGKFQQIAISELVMDDIVRLKQGSQIPADSIIVEGDCEANESLLTGEQDDVHKSIGDNLLSGSFIQSGSCMAQVVAVGSENFASQLMKEAKKFKKTKSELMKSINWIIRIVAIVIVPLGLLMFLTNMKTSSSINIAITSTVASVIGMIPEGLVMLTSVALAVGVVKLSKKRTLVQDLYCIETLARVDCLCLDKTGTITEGSMQVEQTHIYSTKHGFVDDIMANMVRTLGNDGATFNAFSEYFGSSEVYECVKTIPFSSSRKWSGADFGAKGRFIVGAPEFVLKSKIGLVENDVKEFSMQGYRVLVLVKSSQPLQENIDETKLKPIALIVLSDKIRENAKETFEYFARQGVALKVISGDNPITVSKVAERAGLAGANKFIDASQDLDTPEKIFDACDKYTIFGRVSPKQKKMLVSALKKKGYTVGMTGDGVNDVMALKEADCSIAMASGSDASRNVSQLVLLDSEFSALPSVVAEGRRVINNIERASSLFLVKTTFSMLLTLLFIIFQLKYPFEPIQLTLISVFFVGMPSFFLAIEPNDRKVEGNFLGKVFKKALPGGMTVALMVLAISYYYRDIGIDVSSQISTMAFFITAVVSFCILMQVCMPYTKERLFLIALCTVVFVSIATSQYFAELFAIVPLTKNMTIRLVVVLLCIVPCIAVMRAEVEAIRGLIKETSSFIKKTNQKIKKFFGNRRNKL